MTLLKIYILSKIESKNKKIETMKKFIKKHKFRLQIIMMWFRFILANAAFIIGIFMVTFISIIMVDLDKPFAAKFAFTLILLGYFGLSDVLFYLPLKSINNLEFVDNNEDNMFRLLPLKISLIGIQKRIIIDKKLYGYVSGEILAEKAKLEDGISKLEWFG